MKASLVHVGSPRWTAILRATPHDFYHLPAYVALAASWERGEPRALIVEDAGRSLLLPMILRPIAGGGIDAASPYGYPGPLLTGTDDPAYLRDALVAGARVLESAQVVSLFVRFHPLLNPAPPEDVGTVVTHGGTVAVDLTQPAEVLWQQTRRDHRRDIERARKVGHRVSIDTNGQHFDAFERLYRQTMTRVSASPDYFFDSSYFQRLRKALGERLVLAVTDLNGVVVAAGLYTETCGIVQAHLSGTDNRFDQSAPTKLMDDFVRAWAKDRGDHWLHFGGGRGVADDSLFMYKSGFSPLRFPFHTLRMVINAQAYAQLVAAQESYGDPTALDGFFPQYRRGRISPPDEVRV